MPNLGELYILIRRFEGCKLTPYLCPAGVLTVGWGSTGHGVVIGQSWTQAEADARLEQDALKFARGTLAYCPNLAGNAGGLCAIADYAYNLGLGQLRSSTLRRRVLVSDWRSVAFELRRWVRGGGRVLPGLVKRREAEIALLV